MKTCRQCLLMAEKWLQIVQTNKSSGERETELCYVCSRSTSSFTLSDVRYGLRTAVNRRNVFEIDNVSSESMNSSSYSSEVARPMISSDSRFDYHRYHVPIPLHELHQFVKYTTIVSIECV